MSPPPQLRSLSLLPDAGRAIPEMASLIQQVLPPPATLGGRSSNAAHRLSAFLHSLHLITGDFVSLRQLLSSLMSITTDMGVESLLTRLEPFALSSVLQFFKPLEDKQIVDHAGLQDIAFRVVPGDVLPDQDFGFCVRAEDTFDIEGQGQGPAAEDTLVSLEHCRGVGGLLHVIHNATRDLNLGACMRFYEEHVSNLSVVARFLKERHSKERLISRCFSRGLPAEAPFKSLIESFSSECYRARWGTVASCALAVREVLPALRFGWDAGKYLEGSGAARADSVAIPEVDRLVRCPFFEAYLCMIQTISELVLHLISWVEACPCHWHLLTAGASELCLLRLDGCWSHVPCGVGVSQNWP